MLCFTYAERMCKEKIGKENIFLFVCRGQDHFHQLSQEGIIVTSFTVFLFFLISELKSVLSVKQVPLPVKKAKVDGKEEPSEAKDREPVQEPTKEGKKAEGKKGADKGQTVEKKGSEQGSHDALVMVVHFYRESHG